MAQGPVPERLISANPGLRFCSTFNVLLRESFRMSRYCVSALRLNSIL